MVFRTHSRGRVIPLAAVVAAAACIFFMKSGLLVIVFLVPLGFVRFRYNSETAWTAFGIAAAVNLVLALLSVPILKTPAAFVILDQIFFAALAGVFTWINGPLFLAFPGPWRMLTGSVLAAFAFVLFFMRIGDELLYEAIKAQIEALNSFYSQGSPTGASDTARNELFASLTPEAVLEAAKAIMIRGGALVSSVSLFWINRLASLGLVRLFRGSYGARRIKDFYADSRLIWIFSFSLILILVFRITNFAPPEIPLWNILVLCVILYLAQGIGVLQHFVSRPGAPSFLRLVIPVIVVFVVLSPGINVAVLGLVVLLGIAENWARFRSLKTEAEKAP